MPSSSCEFAVRDIQVNPDLSFESNEVKKFIIEFTADPGDVNTEIQIGTVILQMGNPEVCSVELKLSNVGTKANNSVCSELLHFKMCPRNMPDFENIKPLSVSQIIPRCSFIKVNFQHAQPALLGEWYNIKVGVKNEEVFSISDVQATFCLGEDESSNEGEISIFFIKFYF